MCPAGGGRVPPRGQLISRPRPQPPGKSHISQTPPTPALGPAHHECRCFSWKRTKKGQVFCRGCFILLMCDGKKRRTEECGGKGSGGGVLGPGYSPPLPPPLPPGPSSSTTSSSLCALDAPEVWWGLCLGRTTYGVSVQRGDNDVLRREERAGEA